MSGVACFQDVILTEAQIIAYRRLHTSCSSPVATPGGRKAEKLWEFSVVALPDE